MQLIEVGRPYVAGITQWPQTGEYNYIGGEHQLRLFWDSPTAQEVREVRRGVAQFAFVHQNQVIFFLYRFGMMPWADAPFSIHLVPASYRQLPPPSIGPDARALLRIILVDASTGIVKAARLMTFSPDFSGALEAAIRKQAEAPWPGDADYDIQIQAVYRRYPTPRSMLDAAVARTVGGA